MKRLNNKASENRKVPKGGYIELYILLTILILVSSCRGDDEEIVPSYPNAVTPGVETERIKGFYLLNEGNMGSNKASIDYFDYKSGTYFLNIYPTINPEIIHELGDVGNDVQIYGTKLYAVINGSDYVEVMDVATGKHHASVTVQNCRYVSFDRGYAYVSSYNGPIKIEPDAPLGCVQKIDTATMQIVGTCTVGYQPEEMVIRNNKLYVANSGGYRAPDYDSTVSVIDLNTFKEIKKIPVAINLHRMELASDGSIYVSSRGDSKSIGSNTYIIDMNDNISKTLNVACSEMAVCGDSIYFYSTEWSSASQSNTVTYGIINTQIQNLVSTNFITDGTEKGIQVPFGLAVNPETREIFVSDARDYVTPGVLYCFSREGKRKWAVTTGDIPSRIAFAGKQFTNVDLLNN